MSRLAAVDPSANRGQKSPNPNPQLAFVDFLTFTVHGATNLVSAAKVADEFLRFAPGIVRESNLRGFRNFYENHFRFIDPETKACVGFVAFGGAAQRGTACIEFTGAGCAHVKAWAQLADFLDGHNARITRVDCAHDDFEGTHPISWAREQYHAGAFTRGGRPPKAQFIDDEGSGAGCTLYVGTSVSNQQLCVYEKGKQLKDTTSKWVRYEGRFGARDREIPTDVIRNPHAYLVGHFRPLNWIATASTVMRTSREKLKASMAGAVANLRRQYGPTLATLRAAAPHEFAKNTAALCRERLPTWAAAVPLVGLFLTAHIGT